MLLGAATAVCALDCRHWMLGIVVAFGGIGLLAVSSNLLASGGSADAWTLEIPNAEGYYWVRGDRVGVMGVVQVENWHGELQTFHGGVWRPLADKKYFAGMEWSAPIYPPNEKS